jgi:hypothetical protein
MENQFRRRDRRPLKATFPDAAPIKGRGDVPELDQSWRRLAARPPPCALGIDERRVQGIHRGDLNPATVRPIHDLKRAVEMLDERGAALNPIPVITVQ